MEAVRIMDTPPNTLEPVREVQCDENSKMEIPRIWTLESRQLVFP